VLFVHEIVVGRRLENCGGAGFPANDHVALLAPNNVSPTISNQLSVSEMENQPMVRVDLATLRHLLFFSQNQN
jgi:hypothetical protein